MGSATKIRTTDRPPSEPERDDGPLCLGPHVSSAALYPDLGYSARSVGLRGSIISDMSSVDSGSQASKPRAKS